MQKSLLTSLSGLVYAGVGWIIWRDESYLPKHLIFELHYLGGTEESYTLNFSRPGAQIIAQYFNLMHLGFKGYRAIMENALANARLLSRALEKTGWYRCVSNIHRKKGELDYNRETATTNPYEEGSTSAEYNAGLPVVAFTLTDEYKKQYPHVKQVAVSNLLRAKQYIIPSKSFEQYSTKYSQAIEANFNQTTRFHQVKKTLKFCESLSANLCL
jgi:glutamate decarboxylase